MANEAPERVWANPDAGYCTTVGESTYTTEYIRADLATTHELDQLRDRVKELESLLQEADFWLEGALTCKSWSWDADQHEAATDTLARIRTARRVREGGKD